MYTVKLHLKIVLILFLYFVFFSPSLAFGFTFGSVYINNPLKNTNNNNYMNFKKKIYI